MRKSVFGGFPSMHHATCSICPCNKDPLIPHFYTIKLELTRVYSLLYPQHLCRRVYSFRLSVRPFVCSFILPSRSWNLRQSFALKFLKWCISQQLLIRKHSYLDHSYLGGLAFTP